jgi:hypothetical protein
MSGTTERVVNVVLRATEINPADRFGSISEFSEQFGFAVRESAEDLVHGAFEAISSRNVELARLLAAKAALYNPSADSLTLLNLQLGGGSPFGATPAVAPAPPGLPVEALAAPALTLPPMTGPGESENLLSPELSQGLPPEFLQMIAPQFDVTRPKKGMNPIFVLVIGGIGVILLLLIAALATLILSGS